MRYLILVAFLTGCASHVPYQAAAMSDWDARAVIEQVLMEQPAQHRPSAVEFTDTFIEVQMGAVSRTRGGIVPVGGVAVAGAKSRSRELNNRLYFSTIADTQLHHKRDWYILDICDSEGRVLQRTYTRDEGKARRFVDAVAALKS